MLFFNKRKIVYCVEYIMVSYILKLVIIYVKIFGGLPDETMELAKKYAY